MDMRMKKLFFCLFVGFLFLAVAIEKSAQSQTGIADHFGYSHSRGEIPPGMEEIEVTSGYRIIVPKGSKTRRIGAQLMIEGDSEYMARRFEEMEKEILRLNESFEELQERIHKIEKAQDL